MQVKFGVTHTTHNNNMVVSCVVVLSGQVRSGQSV